MAARPVVVSMIMVVPVAVIMIVIMRVCVPAVRVSTSSVLMRMLVIMRVIVIVLVDGGNCGGMRVAVRVVMLMERVRMRLVSLHLGVRVVMGMIVRVDV